MEDSKIEWTDHTFNPWIGCQRVSEGCVHCYAETLNKRWGKKNWGPLTDRPYTSPANWAKPKLWDKKAQAAGVRHKVFCASMADVFEDKDEVFITRAILWNLIKHTPNLDWLILTKRPENFAKMLPPDWGDGWPNVWLGVSVENQKRADERIPILTSTPAKVRFLSCEPLLEGIILPSYKNGLDWVIVGGESGPGKRPFNPDWARSLRDDCKEAGIAFFMKQIDKVKPIPEDLMIRQFPKT